jgi:nicotinate-nucleotide adenylyltransferase
VTPSRAPRLRRIGVYGGSFDPIHVGHLRAAEDAREQLALDRVLFIPCGDPPHKQRRLAAAADRVAMTRAAIRGNPYFRVSSIEADRGGLSYTIDTVHALLGARAWRDVRLTLLIGLDAYRELGTWKRYRELLALVDIAVWSRPAYRAGALRPLLPVAARKDFCYGPDHNTLRHRTGNQIRFLTVTAIDLSASDIRLRVQRGESIRYLVPPAVASYIARHRLYRRRPVAS